jgi:Ribonucleotide reductase, alpha subunit
VRERVKKGIRNSNIMAIAPTATIANITGVSQSIEPTYQNLYVKSNLSGEFTVINPYLVRDLKARGLWDSVMINDLKYYDGSVQQIERIPQELKDLYATAFEVETKWIVDAASRRQKWIDQAQSLNLYIAGASGKKLDVTYRMAWYRGLKTTYYLRAPGRDQHREVDHQHRQAQRRFQRWRQRPGPGSRPCASAEGLRDRRA